MERLVWACAQELLQKKSNPNARILLIERFILDLRNG